MLSTKGKQGEGPSGGLLQSEYVYVVTNFCVCEISLTSPMKTLQSV